MYTTLTIFIRLWFANYKYQKPPRVGLGGF